MNFTTSENDFKLFEKEVKRWKTLLGLNDWRISTRHRKLESAMADTAFRTVNRVATLTLSKSWAEIPTPKEIKLVAAHECFHVLLADIFVLAESRYSTKDEIYTANEAAVVRLENLITQLGVV